MVGSIFPTHEDQDGHTERKINKRKTRFQNLTKKKTILHSYWSDCGLTGRSAADEPVDGGALIPERSADGPTSATDLPNWAFFLIGLVVGGIVTVGVIAIIAIAKHRSEVCLFRKDNLTIVG
jgi:hypothetical protein